MLHVTNQKWLLKLAGVSKFYLKPLGLMRFLVHDKPFVAFAHDALEGEVAHLRLNKHACRDAVRRYPNIVRMSDFYQSERWIAVRVNKMDAKFFKEMLLAAYRTAAEEMSDLSRIVYADKNPIKYDLDYKRILEEAQMNPDIDFSKTYVDLGEDN